MPNKFSSFLAKYGKKIVLAATAVVAPQILVPCIMSYIGSKAGKHIAIYKLKKKLKNAMKEDRKIEESKIEKVDGLDKIISNDPNLGPYVYVRDENGKYKAYMVEKQDTSLNKALIEILVFAKNKLQSGDMNGILALEQPNLKYLIRTSFNDIPLDALNNLDAILDKYKESDLIKEKTYNGQTLWVPIVGKLNKYSYSIETDNNNNVVVDIMDATKTKAPSDIGEGDLIIPKMVELKAKPAYLRTLQELIGDKAITQNGIKQLNESIVGKTIYVPADVKKAIVDVAFGRRREEPEQQNAEADAGNDAAMAAAAANAAAQAAQTP